ncbi:hypothetical protein C8R44DRAFT_983635 [Mycena epipterygia]|nr:hypothetical protein C8R44DRAFT_983635 [Mycena epipterygia]
MTERGNPLILIPAPMASSSSSSSSSSSPSEYISDPVTNLLYTPTTPFLSDPSCRPFRIITQASLQNAPEKQNKRKRDALEAGYAGAGEMNQFRVVVRQPLLAASPGPSFGPSGKLKAKPPRPYATSADLLAALQTSCVSDPEVDFSGSYPAPSGPLSDKQLVQEVAHDIWKATGYRFTVKDHPPTEHGHKTRLWCSQDAARRSKHPQRISRRGELFARPRYACRSRLMIACLPEGVRGGGGGGEYGNAARGDYGRGNNGGGRLVTVRMHHYLRHEAYQEPEASPPAQEQEQQQPQHQQQIQQQHTHQEQSQEQHQERRHSHPHPHPHPHQVQEQQHSHQAHPHQEQQQQRQPQQQQHPGLQFLSAISRPLPAHLQGGGVPALGEQEGEWAVDEAQIPMDPGLQMHQHTPQMAHQHQPSPQMAHAHTPQMTHQHHPHPITPVPQQIQISISPAPVELHQQHTPPQQMRSIPPHRQQISIPPHQQQISIPPQQMNISPAPGDFLQQQQQHHTSPQQISIPPQQISIRPQQISIPPATPSPPPTPDFAQTRPPTSQTQTPDFAQTPPPAPPALPPAELAQLTPAAFEHRMRTHIARIRDFCDGLEWQAIPPRTFSSMYPLVRALFSSLYPFSLSLSPSLPTPFLRISHFLIPLPIQILILNHLSQVQFGDTRMLAALERDAAPFLALLDGCLRVEGR